MLALKLWRAGMWCHRRGFGFGARFFKSIIFLVFGAILEPEVTLEGHVNFAHRGLGVVIHGSTVIGDWVQIWQYATIASVTSKDEGDTGVRLGREVVIGAHAIVMCPKGRTLTIGDHAVIGAGAIVVDDVPAHAVVLPERSRVVTAASARERANVDG